MKMRQHSIALASFPLAFPMLQGTSKCLTLHFLFEFIKN